MRRWLSSRKVHLAIGVLVSAFVPRAVCGQAAPESTLGADRKDSRLNMATLPTVATPTSPGYSVSFDATTTEKKGSVAIVLGTAADNKTFTITAFGPLDQNTGEATPLSLQGLGSSAGVEVALNLFHWKGVPDARGMRLYCDRKLHKEECDDTDFKGAERAEFLDLAHVNETPWLFTLDGAVGRNRFKFSRTRVPYSSEGENHNDWSLGWTLGRYTPALGYVAASYDYERTWSAAGAPRQICSPVDSSTSLECRSFVVGPPEQGTQQVVNVQWRRFLSGGKVAFNPMLGRDLEEDVTFFRLPVYFFSNDNGGLAGGARFEWRSDTREPVFVVFVGALLRLVG
jgi:hypothetical protein